MAVTLYDATLALAKILNTVVEADADSGSTTILVDGERTEPDDHFTDGTIWIKDASLYRKVTDYVSSSGTFTFATIAPAADADELYAAANKQYPLDLLIQSINSALKELGNLPAKDTSLVTVANQDSYSLPTGIRNIMNLRVAQSTAEPYGYQRNQNWDEQGGKIYFDHYHKPITDGYKIELTYKKDHQVMALSTDEIDPEIPLQRVIWEAAVKHAYPWRIRRLGTDNKDLEALLILAERQLARIVSDHPVYADDNHFSKDPHHASW